jgi:3-dehydroquinate synthetase
MIPPLTPEGFMPYPIIIERGCAWRLPQIMANRADSRRLVLVSDKEVAALYQDALKERFKAAGVPTQVLVIDGSEAGKTIDSVRSLYEQLSDMEMSVNDLLVAFGGGSVIDVASFVAATYLGGLDYLLVPTSLLAMADSSTSFNCRLNYRTSKNLLGMACQPKMVLIDVDLLKTLPAKHLANGYAQIIQYGYVQNPEIIDMLESGESDMETLLRATMAAKLALLSDNPIGQEFGKPVGNAIEGHFRFLKYLSGEALALAMLAISPSGRLRALLNRYHLPTRLEGVSTDTLVRRMQRMDIQQGTTVKLVRVHSPGQLYIQELRLDQTESIYQGFLTGLTGAV